MAAIQGATFALHHHEPTFHVSSHVTAAGLRENGDLVVAMSITAAELCLAESLATLKSQRA